MFIPQYFYSSIFAHRSVRIVGDPTCVTISKDSRFALILQNPDVTDLLLISISVLLLTVHKRRYIYGT